MLSPAAVSKTRRKSRIHGTTVFTVLLICFSASLVSGRRSSLEEEERFTFGEGNDTRKYTEEELGVPRCESNHDCVANGVCHKGEDGFGRCLCPGSCPSYVPVKCTRKRAFRMQSKDNQPCMVHGNYTKKFSLSQPICFVDVSENNQAVKRLAKINESGSCACPPMFDASPFPTVFNTNDGMLPIRCDKREMNVKLVAVPSPSVFRGADVVLFCCTNMDPSKILDVNSVQFIQNTTILRETSTTPFDEESISGEQRPLISPPWCWTLRITNAQFADAGQYSCLLSTPEIEERDDHVQIVVKAPRSISDFNVTTNTTFAELTWKKNEEDPSIVIDLRLIRRTDRFTPEIWSMKNASSPVIIKDLRAATPYTIYVAVMDGTSDPYKFSQTFQTSDGRPFAPKMEGVRVQDERDGMFCEVEWRKPSNPNGRITKYFVQLEGKVRNLPESLEGEEEGAHYPQPHHERCANYDDTENSDNSINPVEFPSDEFFACKYGPLLPNRNYTIKMWAENKASQSSKINFTRHCVTDYAEPDVVELPQSIGSQHNKTHFTLRFDKPPRETNGPISCYFVAIVPLPANISIDAIPKSRDINMDTVANVYANNLGKAFETKRYLAYIAESYSDLPHETVIGDDQITEGRSSCPQTYLTRFREDDSPLRPGMKYTGFLIVRVDKIGRGPDDPLKNETLLTTTTTTTPAPRAYSPWSTRRPPAKNGRGKREAAAGAASAAAGVAAAASTTTTTVAPPGVGEPIYGYSEYFKPILLRIEDDSPPMSGILIGVCVLFALIVLAVLAMLAAHRFGLFTSIKKGDGAGSPLSTGATIMLSKVGGERRSLLKPEFGSIPADNLPSEFIIRHRDSDYLFAAEFEALPSPKLPATASVRNSTKNRYKDIVAFDETRVTLQKVNGMEQSDYINANWIKSYGDRKKFIASQAPLDTTLIDFWRMIWERDIRVVVMLSNLVEKNRNQSAKYWPDELRTRSDEHPAYVGGFSIVPCGQHYMADHCIRSFDVTYQGGQGSTRASPEATVSITSEYANVPSSRGSIGAVISEPGFGMDGQGETRRIVQYHYTAWNDYKAPDCPAGLLRFLMKLRALPEYEENPVIVHCSAGVGRTGTLIAIDSLIDMCATENRCDVYGFVGSMRRQRNLMVQNVEQYVFIYRALAENQMFGFTDRSVDEFNKQWREMGRNKKMIEEEFSRLKNTLETPATHKFADQNPEKNRYPSAVPYDSKRVILSPIIGGHADAQYINASTVKGHFYPYILAQDPLGKDTVFDFWRMIIDHNVSTIVMLTPDEQFKEEERYWPEDDRSTMYINKIVVNMIRDEPYGGGRERTLTYQTNNEKPRTVVQYTLAGWAEGRPRPTDAVGMISVIGRVLERQSKLADDMSPILLHSRNGSTECGVLCAISLLVERLKAEHRIDVFRTVHGIRHTRPHTFASLEEYEFVYDTMHNVIRHGNYES